ncbi:hypothetical protein EMIHUDRAFT_210764 [Emiliania huxleyi CCMP1516]|uniref:Fe2OG dioxygenase domain-containing protein n=2 Tax=Emiliania huxleyi TaxID=2903 RepID=A0A0D3IYP3_EMIH1|nr:hypothetical protein EMIHUDRAFT_210764 [Emiliania huxleyi CCMP1516]EOD16378.1 hypothetical protein EMIHUDRAFT_210764 [Emiliania huxleyi CCMP1516]|eukprot:XP_005768807.1 hypothetical protein EMIHUDRAFT_210764 [Emiliania huxleyi CCMP1516]
MPPLILLYWAILENTGEYWQILHWFTADYSVRGLLTTVSTRSGRSCRSGIVVMVWSCQVCTFENVHDEYLACEAKRPRLAPSAESAPVGGPAPAAPAPAPAAPAPARSIANVLRPKRSSDFAGSVTVKVGAEAPRRVADASLHQYAPAAFARDFLPAREAHALLRLLHADGASWRRHPWFIFNQWRETPRCSKGFRMEASAAPSRICGEQGDGEARHGSIYAPADASADASPDLLAALRSASARLAEHVAQIRPGRAAPWLPTLALGNRYADHQDSVGAHSDYLGELGPRPIIVGLALGACRDFVLASRAADPPTTVRIPMPHNSIVVMWGECQERWDHAVPACGEGAVLRHALVGPVRYSLTFRMSRAAEISRPKCRCDKPAELKWRGTGYRWCCAGHAPRGDEHTRPDAPPPRHPCGFSAESPWATAEAARLAAAEPEYARVVQPT